jgi:ubiquinone/menaquinone biosynthesis C-methylase UbiE
MKLNWAERWVVNNPLRVLMQRLEIRLFRKILRFQPGPAVLEIGCGRGAGARLILKHFHPHNLYLMDLDVRMIRTGRAYLSPGERARVAFSVGDAARLPFRSGALDAVFGFGFLHHVPDWRAAVREVSRVLRDGGRYCMEELYPSLYQNALTGRILAHPTEDRFRSDDLREALNQADLPIREAFDLRGVGILGVAIKGG